MGVAQEHGHAWGPLRGTRGSCHALILLLSLTQVLIHMIYMIARPQRQPHLSKNRQPRVLARIQPQLICIPSYSCIASTSSARKGSRTSSARPPSACHKPSALSACPAPSAPSRCPAPSSTPARSAHSSKGRCLDANLQPPWPPPSPLPWVHKVVPNAHSGSTPMLDRFCGRARRTEPRAYGGGAGGSIGFSVRYQGELLGLWDLQNRDPRRKSPPETEKSVG